MTGERDRIHSERVPGRGRQPARGLGAGLMQHVLPALLFAVSSYSAQAHPHVSVTARMVVEFNNGAVQNILHSWIFDEMYSMSMIEGLDVNKDGKYDRDELMPLAKENVEALKDYKYFTFAKLGDQDLNFGAPNNYWFEYDGTNLILHLTLPLSEPLVLAGHAMSIAVEDESYFVAFGFATEEPARISGSPPAGCQAALKAPAVTEEGKSLADAFGSQMGSLDGEAGNTIEVRC